MLFFIFHLLLFSSSVYLFDWACPIVQLDIGYMRNKTKLPVVVSDTVDCRSSLVVDNYVNVGQNDNISVMYTAPSMFSIRECGLYINHKDGDIL